MTVALAARRLRLPLGFLAGGLYLVLARPTPGGLLLGLPVAFAGLLVRAWASGHIVKNERLATTGPYAHTRNPLYFGSFLLAAGFALAVHWSLLLVVIALFVFIYGPTIERERQNVSGRFPSEYEAWADNVPVFVPRVTPWREGRQEVGDSFSFSLYWRHREWKAAAVFLLATTWLLLRIRFGF